MQRILQFEQLFKWEKNNAHYLRTKYANEGQQTDTTLLSLKMKVLFAAACCVVEGGYKQSIKRAINALCEAQVNRNASIKSST
jgi:hypothetical protein